MVRFRAVTPDEYKANHEEFKILYGLHITPFGKCLIGVTDTDKAILHLAFADENSTQAVNTLKKEWPLSILVEDTENETEKLIQKVFSTGTDIDDSISLLLKGTEFQLKVWESLMSIPQGTQTTYEKVAEAIDNPKAARAVGNALMKNKIAYLVPCHRVVGKSGSNKYAWGPERKQNILIYERK